MLRHETILGLLDLSQMRGVKHECDKFALKRVPKKSRAGRSCRVMRESTVGLPMRAPSILQRRSHPEEAIPFKSLVNDNSIKEGRPLTQRRRKGREEPS